MNSDTSGASLDGLRANLQSLLKTLEKLLEEIEATLLPNFKRLSKELKERITSSDAKYANHFAKIWFKAFLGIKDEVMVLSKGEIIRRYHKGTHEAFLHSRSKDAHLYNKKYRLTACCKDGVDYEYRYITSKFGHKSFLDKVADKMDVVNDRIDVAAKEVDAQFRRLEVALAAKGAKGVTFTLQHNSEMIKAQLATQAVSYSRSSMGTEDCSRAESLSTTIDDPTELLSNKSLVTSAYESFPPPASSSSMQSQGAARKRALALTDSDDEEDKAEARRRELAKKQREATDFQLSVSIGGIKKEVVHLRHEEDFSEYLGLGLGQGGKENAAPGVPVGGMSSGGTGGSRGDSEVVRAIKMALKNVPRAERHSLVVRLLEGFVQSSATTKSAAAAAGDDDASTGIISPVDAVAGSEDARDAKLLSDSLKAVLRGVNAFECFEMLRVRLYYPCAQQQAGAAAFDFVDAPLYFSYYCDVSSNAPGDRRSLCLSVVELFTTLRDNFMWNPRGAHGCKVLPYLPFLAHNRADGGVARSGGFVSLPADPSAVLHVYCSRNKHMNIVLDAFSASHSSASSGIFEVIEKLCDDSCSCDLAFTDFGSRVFEDVLRIKLSCLLTASSDGTGFLNVIDISNSRNVSGVVLALLLRLGERVVATAALSTACLVDFVANYSSCAPGACGTAGEAAKLFARLKHLDVSHNDLGGGSKSELMKAFETIVRSHGGDDVTILVNDRRL